jgi:hypothetical protein
MGFQNRSHRSRTLNKETVRGEKDAYSKRKRQISETERFENQGAKEISPVTDS